MLTLSMSILYWTSWPDNTDAIAVQLVKMIITHRKKGKANLHVIKKMNPLLLAKNNVTSYALFSLIYY